MRRFVQSFVYYGLIYVLPTVLKASDKSTNVYLDSVYLSVAELPGLLLALLLIDTALGRCGCLTLFLSLAASAVLVCMFETTSGVFFAASMIAKASITGSFSTIYPYSLEVYPTIFRTFALGICSGWSRVGGLITPSLMQGIVDVEWGVPFSHPMPFLCLCLCLIAAVVCTRLLTIETRDAVLPDLLLDKGGLIVDSTAPCQRDTTRHGTSKEVTERSPLVDVDDCERDSTRVISKTGRGSEDQSRIMHK